MPHARSLKSVVVALVLVSCGKSDSPVGTSDVVGAWVGTTSQQQPLSFTVASSGVTDGTFSYQMTHTCTSTTRIQITTTQPLPVNGGGFTTGKTQIGTSTFYTATGKFTSSTAATGTLLIQDGVCRDTLNLTWTASRQ